MKRNIDLNEISDGRLYSSGDMVKADCHDCAGCSACCRGMGDSIKLDPMDIWRLKKGVGKEFTALMEQEIELGIVDGMILPNVRMTDVYKRQLQRNTLPGSHDFQRDMPGLFILCKIDHHS